MKRSLKIEKFRNIGIEKEETLLLNTSLEKGKMGNLIILIGENGSGKSNVLSALTRFKNRKIEQRDITNLKYEDKYRVPKISLVTDDADKYYSLELEFKPEQKYISSTNDTEWDNINGVISIEDAIRIYEFLSQYNSGYKEQIDILKSNEATNESKEQILSELVKYLSSLDSSGGGWHYNTETQIYSHISQNYSNIIKACKRNNIEKFSECYKKQFGFNAIPGITNYEEKIISDEALSCSPNSINEFISMVLDDIKFGKKNIQNAYKMSIEQNNPGIRDDLQKQLNKKLTKISKRFNSIYSNGADNYKFEFKVEATTLGLMIKKNDVPLTLSYQSTGFKWFFNLYFNLLTKNDLNPGDIIVMDEPAVNLHPAGIQELRNFLKEFAIKHDITIILATHSPFLISQDSLDEIRVVKNIEGISYINNDFSTIDKTDPDTLSSIKSALTVKAHILADPEKKTVFVEGITDYNYLTAFKNIFGDKYNLLSFVPIGGIGDIKSPNFDNRQKEILKQLTKISRKKEAILLVDGDKAGKNIEKINGDNRDFKVIALTGINEGFVEIEKVFSAEDRKKFGVQRKNGELVKCSALSANLKNYYCKLDFSEETLKNFKAVMDKLVEEFD